MGSNRNIRFGVICMGVAFIGLIAYLIWNSSRNARQTAIAENAVANNVTQVSMRSGRRTAVARVDLPARSIITAESFRMEELPEGMSTAGFVTDPDAQSIGFITNRPIRRNDRIRTNYLVGHISQVGVAGALQPGTRAMMVPIPSKPTLHDLVRIGDTVDVIAAFDGQESRTIVENVRVLAVDVFVNDTPTTSGAMRGPYKAPPVAIRSENPPSPPQNVAPATAGATPAPGQPTPTPTPTPTPAPQAAPAPALTLEVTPDQANRISLASNSGAAIDFILVPRAPLLFIAPGLDGNPTPVRPVSVTRAQIAPYAESKRSSGTAATRTARTPRATPSTGRIGSGGGGGGDRYSGPSTIPDPEVFGSGPSTGPNLGPAIINSSTAKPTYEIPVFADGKPVRTDVVLKPKSDAPEASY